MVNSHCISKPLQFLSLKFLSTLCFKAGENIYSTNYLIYVFSAQHYAGGWKEWATYESSEKKERN